MCLSQSQCCRGGVSNVIADWVMKRAWKRNNFLRALFLLLNFKMYLQGLNLIYYILCKLDTRSRRFGKRNRRSSSGVAALQPPENNKISKFHDAPAGLTFILKSKIRAPVSNTTSHPQNLPTTQRNSMFCVVSAGSCIGHSCYYNMLAGH